MATAFSMTIDTSHTFVRLDLSSDLIKQCKTEFDFARLVADQITSHDHFEDAVPSKWAPENYGSLYDDEFAQAILGAAQKAEQLARQENIRDYPVILNGEIESACDKCFQCDQDAIYWGAYQEFFGSVTEELLDEIHAEDPGLLSNLQDFDEAEFEENFRCLIMGALEERDTSRPLDIIPGNLYGEWIHVPEFKFGEQYFDDESTYFEGVCSSTNDIIVNEQLLRLFRLAQVSPKEIAEELKSQGSNAEVIRRWMQADEPLLTSNRQQLSSASDLIEIMDNASYGGMPLYFCFINVKDFITRDITQPVTISNGQIGIHNFINGSGHIIDAKAPLTLFPGEGWGVTSQYRYSVDSVYGFHRPAVRGEVSQVRPYQHKAWVSTPSSIVDASHKLRHITGDNWSLDAYESISNPNANDPVGIVRHKRSNLHLYLSPTKDALQLLLRLTEGDPNRASLEMPEERKARAAQELIESGLTVEMTESGQAGEAANPNYEATVEGYAYRAYIDELRAKRLASPAQSQLSPG